MSQDLEPKLTEDWVKIQYWECNVLGHRHKSRKAAAGCIMKRKDESGELKKLTRNLSMIRSLMKGMPVSIISNNHHCTSPNVIKAANSSMSKAWKFASANGGCPYKSRNWKVADFSDDSLNNELTFHLDILQEMEVKLAELIK